MAIVAAETGWRQKKEGQERDFFKTVQCSVQRELNGCTEYEYDNNAVYNDRYNAACIVDGEVREIVHQAAPRAGDARTCRPDHPSSQLRVLSKCSHTCPLLQDCSSIMNEEELDQFNIHVARYRPEELTKLTKTTKFTRKEIQLIYRGFKQECPTGMVDEESFKHIFSQFFPQGDASQYAHYVFNTIKHNQTGKISF
ncbi:Kv channel-interacting protein 4-like [Homalodisca vitripennis]|uniref:Kv channel-interacting protein 4-like n=1 Tax=Homalodisca vitripennis TaxID=197043 RepID=UPI001EECA5F4|nr:Kv channel-interacting protein 4-like [Homalodisca vitripennis]